MSFAPDRAEMDKNILTAISRDEAESFGLIESLHLSLFSVTLYRRLFARRFAAAA